MNAIDKFFDFVLDPFGIQKRKDEKAMKEMIEYLNERSKAFDEAMKNRDNYQMQRQLMLMDKADKLFF